MQVRNLTPPYMRFKINKEKSKITTVNRGGIRLLPTIDGVFDTNVYQDNISVDAGSMAQSDGKYTTRTSEEQVSSAQKEIEELVTYWETVGVAEILDKPKTKAEKAE